MIGNGWGINLKEFRMDLVFSKSMKDINGNNVDLSYLNKKVVLVVNTASKSSLVKRLEGLETIFQKYKDRGFVPLAVPSNTFNNEPLTDAEIAKVYHNEYFVTYPIMTKTDIDQDPLYQTLFKKTGTKPEGDFSVYLVNRGKDVLYYSPATDADNVFAILESIL